VAATARAERRGRQRERLSQLREGVGLNEPHRQSWTLSERLGRQSAQLLAAEVEQDGRLRVPREGPAQGSRRSLRVACRFQRGGSTYFVTFELCSRRDWERLRPLSEEQMWRLSSEHGRFINPQAAAWAAKQLPRWPAAA
jgi:hypothetical protein